MNIILSIGILIFTAFILGELAEKVRLPKISGYILAGILLNPQLFGFMSEQFVEHTDPLLTISLSLITFSIGGGLSYSKIKASARTILFLTIYESVFAFISVFIFMFLTLYFFINIFDSINIIIAVSLVLASLAAPTDPSATLAVVHEYRAKGVVSSSMLEIAAFDDLAGIIIYTLATAFSTLFLHESDIKMTEVLMELGESVGGAILLGGIIGVLFNFIIKMFNKESEGTLIVLTIGLVALTYGVSDFFGFESLLSSMVLGVVVINFNPLSGKIFKLIERYTDELIFVIFFSLSGLHLQLSSLAGSVFLILIYIISRAIGKITGIYYGSTMHKADPKIRKYSAGGLIPQGGIVIALALLLTKDPAFKETASMIIGLVIGAALIHEIVGPIISKWSLKKAGEIQ